MTSEETLEFVENLLLEELRETTKQVHAADPDFSWDKIGNRIVRHYRVVLKEVCGDAAVDKFMKGILGAASN